jgi:hypothetical protein
MVAAISSLYAAWEFFESREASAPASQATPSPCNAAVADHLSWLCNTAISIRKLSLLGFEPQARVISRSFLEAIYQTLVVFDDHQTYQTYMEGVDVESAKASYYKAFAKKQSLHKKVQALEGSFKKLPQAERDDQYDQRVGMLEHYSQATHSSALHVLTAARQPDDLNRLAPTILGHYSLATENTLLNCSHEICYFGILFDHIVRHKWVVTGLENNYQYDLMNTLFMLAATFRTHKPGAKQS